MQEFYRAKTGKLLRKIDKALPGKHVKKTYDALNRTDATILAQPRTNVSRLNLYLQEIKAAETDKCKSGVTERYRKIYSRAQDGKTKEEA